MKKLLEKFMLHVILSFWITVTVLLVNIGISTLYMKRLSMVMARSKNEIHYFLQRWNCVWLELFASYATWNGTRTITNTNRKEMQSVPYKRQLKYSYKKAILFKGWKLFILWSFKMAWYKTSGSSYDIYAANIFYHQSCNVKYAHSISNATLNNETYYIENIQKTVLNKFFEM